MIKKCLEFLKTLLPLTSIFMGYAIFGWGITHNRLNPNYETALGTAFIAGFGFIFIIVGLLLGMILYQTKPAFRRHAVVVITAFIIYLLLFILTNYGKLAVMS